MNRLVIGIHAIGALAALGLLCMGGVSAYERPLAQAAAGKPAAPAPSLPPAEVDKLTAPVALYPDALLAQMLLCASNPGKVGALSEWLRSQTLKGSELQDAAKAAGFGARFAARAVFPQVVEQMAGQIEWTAKLGQAFEADRSAVFASIQRLRAKAQEAGK